MGLAGWEGRPQGNTVGVGQRRRGGMTPLALALALLTALLLALALKLAMRASGSACIHAASRCSWSEQPACAPSLLVDSEKLHRDFLELVIAHSGEDVSWSDPYDAIRTVYIRPDATDGHRPSASRVIELRNIRLEQYSCAHFADRVEPRVRLASLRCPQAADVVPACSLLQMCATLWTTTTR